RGLIVLFFNVLALRSDLGGEGGGRGGGQEFVEFLGGVREMTLNGYGHQDLPFERLVAELELERDLSYSPLFQVIFEMNNVPQEAVTLPGLRVEAMGMGPEVVKVDLTLTLEERGGGELVGSLQYSRDLFDGTTIERMIGHYLTLLEGVVEAEGEVGVWEVSLLTAGERRQVVEEWNRTEVEYGEGVCMHELFERQGGQAGGGGGGELGGGGVKDGGVGGGGHPVGDYVGKGG